MWKYINRRLGENGNYNTSLRKQVKNLSFGHNDYRYNGQ